VKRRTGIPTCVGVAPTKTLAKLANRLAKKVPDLDGVLYLESAERRAWALKQVAVGDVWGIGRQYAAKLTAAGIDTAADLARVSDAWARKHLGASWYKNYRASPARGCTLRKMEPLAAKASAARARSAGR